MNDTNHPLKNMELQYFKGTVQWLDMAATWIVLLPILTFLLTGNWKKGYSASLGISFVSLFLLALADNRYLDTGMNDWDIVLANFMLTLHSLSSCFFMVHFTGEEKRKDQRLVLYVLMAGFILLFALVGLKPVVFFIVNMVCSIILVLYGSSAVRTLWQDYRAGDHVLIGRVIMALTMLVGRLALLGLYGLAFAMSPHFEAFTIGFECLVPIWTIAISAGLLKDAGYNPDREDDDGPYQPLVMEPEN